MDTIARRDSSATNFDEVTKRLGIEQGWGVLPRLALLHACAVRKCRECADPEACRVWLTATTGRAVAPPRGCPNKDLLLELLYDRPAGCTRASVG